MYSINEATIVEGYSVKDIGVRDNTDFLRALRHAITHDELNVEYQPRYTVKSGQATIFEALVRWHRKDFGTIKPEKLIATAIRYGLIFSLDLCVFNRCCIDLIKLRESIGEDVKIAVNISPIECESLHQTQKLISVCKSHGLQLSDFEFEITESSHINDSRRIKVFCDTVINLGGSVSLDDFGTCYSPLNNLCDLPVSYIKIDKSFTSKIGYGGRSEILINHLIELAHEMSIKVVVEGIEHAYQRDQIIRMGCDQLQGFYMCRSLAPEKITAEKLNMYLM